MHNDHLTELKGQLWPRVRTWGVNALHDTALHAIGKPGQLIRFIQEGSIQPFRLKRTPPSIWFRSVPRWDTWHRDFEDQPTHVDVWVMQPGQYRHRKQKGFIEPMTTMVINTQTTNQELDISAVNGISASKSSGLHFDSIEAFASDRCYHLIGEAHADDLLSNMNWSEIRRHNMRFRTFSWAANSPYWMNAGGSHHFAAAHCIAQQSHLKYTLEGTHKNSAIQPEALQQFSDQWNMFLMDRVACYGFFMDALARYRCDFSVAKLPSQLFTTDTFKPEGSTMEREVVVVLLKADDKKACTVASVLKAADFQHFNPYIDELC